MSRQTLGVVIVTLGVLAASPAPAQDARLLEAYEVLAQERDEIKRHNRQLELLKLTLDSTESSMAAVEEAGQAFEQAATLGMLLAPSPRVAKGIKGLSDEAQAASERLSRRWPAQAARGVLALRDYAGKVEAADAELGLFFRNKNMPPDAALALATLRGFGETLKWLGEVPLIGEVLEQYGELVATMSHTLRRNYRAWSSGGKEKALLNSFSTELRRDFPSTLPTETEVLRATGWRVPLLMDGNSPDPKNPVFYLKAGKRWVKVDGAEIASIVADLILVYGQPEASLVERGINSMKATVKEWRTGERAGVDWTNPPAMALVLMARKPREEVYGLSRLKLRELAKDRLALLADRREMVDVLQGLPATEDDNVRGKRYHKKKGELRKTAAWLGVPLHPKRERNLMRDLFIDEERTWKALRTSALRLHPGGEDYVRGLGEDPWTMGLLDLGVPLRELRGRPRAPKTEIPDAFVQVEVTVVADDGHTPVPNAQVTLVRALDLAGHPRPQTGPLATRRGRTDAGGVARVTVLRGHHFVSATATGFESASGGPPTAFRERTVKLANPPHRATVTLTKPFEFEELGGTVLTRIREQGTNAPISGARVTLRWDGQELEATADAQGEARIEDIPFGRWTLRVEAEGFQGRSMSDFEVSAAKPDRRGTLRLRRLPPEVQPASLSTSTPGPPAPEPDEKTCGYQPLAEWKDQKTSEVVNRSAAGASVAGGGARHQVLAPDPGRLRVTLRIFGKHDNSNTRYGSQRYRSKVLVTADPSVTDGGRVLGGDYYSGVTDSSRTSGAFTVKGPGAVSLQFVPESCALRKSSEGARCYYPGATEAPGVKLHPMGYNLSVEFDPCGK